MDPKVKAALDKIARTGSLGREPTFAHPDCTCIRAPRERCPVHKP